MKPLLIAGLALLAIAVHLVLRWTTSASDIARDLPLFIALAGGGAPLVYDLARKALRRVACGTG